MTVQTRAICYFFPPRSSAWCWSSRTPRHYKSNREQSCRDHFPPLRNHDSLENSLHHSSACCCISWDGNQSVLNCEHYSLAFTSLDKGIGGGICHTIHIHTHDCLLTCSHHHVALLSVVRAPGGRRPMPPAYSLVILVRTVALYAVQAQGSRPLGYNINNTQASCSSYTSKTAHMDTDTKAHLITMVSAIKWLYNITIKWDVYRTNHMHTDQVK